MVHPSLGPSAKNKRKRRTMENRLPIFTDSFIQIMNIQFYLHPVYRNTISTVFLSKRSHNGGKLPLIFEIVFGIDEDLFTKRTTFHYLSLPNSYRMSREIILRCHVINFRQIHSRSHSLTANNAHDWMTWLHSPHRLYIYS